MSEPLLLVDRREAALWITLNRPERLNAIHLELRDQLWAIIGLLRDDPTLRVAVFRGAGERAFSAGADITEFGTAPSVLAAREARLDRDLWGELARLEVPLIAAIHGFAYGAGLELSLYCDLRLAADDARFAIPEVTLGYIPSAGGTQTVARHINRGDALRMATTGEAVDAAEAFELGLVHAVVPRAQLDNTAEAWAERLASRDPAATRATKRAVTEGLDRRLAEGLQLERRIAAALAS